MFFFSFLPKKRIVQFKCLVCSDLPFIAAVALFVCFYLF